MKQYKTFRFIDVVWQESIKSVVMRYGLDDEIVFTDTVVFEFDLSSEFNRELLERAMRSLWLVNGVSYYKAALTPKIDAQAAHLTAAEAEFLSTTYRLGLGQLCYEHKLPLDRVAVFKPIIGAVATPVAATGLSGSVVGLGGGKDSLVTTTILEKMGEEFVTFSATYMPEENGALAQLAEVIGKPHLVIRRRFDPQLAQLNRDGAYNGHVPVTAIITLIGLVAAILTGRRQVIMSNEASAGEGNVEWDGVMVNHQYSKTLAYERLLSEHITSSVSPDLQVFSLLRPLGELQIAKLFAAGPMQRFQGLYSSCNRNFKADAGAFGWCGECSKCAFVYLILSPFVSKKDLRAVFGADLLTLPALQQTYRELFGLSGHKPFECVGEIAECRAAATQAFKSGDYPELADFHVPTTGFDMQQWHDHLLPERFEAALKVAFA